MAKVGRPLKFQSINDLANHINKTNYFCTEQDFQKYLVDNAHIWVKEFYGEEIENLKQNAYLSTLKKFGANKPRIDLLIRTATGHKIGIEVKNPKQIFHELTRSISQLLSYSCIAEAYDNALDSLAIVTSKIEPVTVAIIKKYNLPIRLFVVNQELHCEIV